MPRYRFAYTVETPLAATRDITFTNAGFPVTLRFADRIDDMHIRLDAVAEGDNWRAANESVMDNVISPVLDALALHRKAPAMLQNLLHVVKAENGGVRRAIVIENRSEQRPVDVDAVAVREVQESLNVGGVNQAAVRWLRYCYRPITVLERFVYSWLALENFLGTKQVRGKCPTCETELPPHPAVNQEAAYELIRATQPHLSAEESKRTFRSWWTELRSPIFHGGRVANTAIRGRMQAAMDVYRPAVENRLQRSAGFRLAYPGTVPNDGLLQHQISHFIEFPAADAAKEFAEPPLILRVLENQPLPPGVTLHNFADDTQNW